MQLTPTPTAADPTARLRQNIAAHGSRLRVALLHLAPVPGDLERNRRLVETAIETAAGMGVDWIVTPELCECGYAFADRIGVEWIAPQPDPWMRDLSRLIAQQRVTVFLSRPERDPRAGKLHNTLFVIGAQGEILGSHRKINSLKIGPESWSSPGDRADPIVVEPWGRVGLLVCADAYTPRIATTLRERGAQWLVSSAAWHPGAYGPNGEWERCTADTGLPLFVCNRTGMDDALDFTASESVAAHDGQRLLSFSSARPAVLRIEWDTAPQTLVGQQTCIL